MEPPCPPLARLLAGVIGPCGPGCPTSQAAVSVYQLGRLGDCNHHPSVAGVGHRETRTARQPDRPSPCARGASEKASAPPSPSWNAQTELRAETACWSDTAATTSNLATSTCAGSTQAWDPLGVPPVNCHRQPTCKASSAWPVISGQPASASAGVRRAHRLCARTAVASNTSRCVLDEWPRFLAPLSLPWPARTCALVRVLIISALDWRQEGMNSCMCLSA